MYVCIANLVRTKYIQIKNIYVRTKYIFICESCLQVHIPFLLCRLSLSCVITNSRMLIKGLMGRKGL